MPDARQAIHAALTIEMGWLAIILALPGNTFASSRSYDAMAALMTEDHWAMVFWLVATVGLVGIATSNPALRLVSVLVLATTLGVLVGCVLVANPISTGTGTYAVLAGLGYYLALRRTHEGLA